MSPGVPHTSGTPGTDTGDQSAVLAFLRNPASYGPEVDTVDCIETHGALVFLAGDHAYKLKRAVKLPYMDFSTLEKRAAACHHEIERNQAAAPDIYLAASAIVRHPDGTLSIAWPETDAPSEPAEPLDWLVIMRRFDQADLLDNAARQGCLTREHMVALAEEIAAYHAVAPVYRALDGNDILANVATQTIMALSQAGPPIDIERVHSFAGHIVAELNKLSHVLRARSQNGYVRLCHGDLHLRNIVLQDGKPTLFDAIEFDDRIARIDVLYDLAFLLMDLWHRGLKHHANMCFNTYASAAMTSDALSGLAALPAFLATRATVRAVVALDKAALPETTNRSANLAEADAYFTLANQFLATGEPMLIAVGGYSGTGKTTLAAALAPTIGHAPGALHLRSDVERKRMAGLDLLQRLPRQAYSPASSAKVYKRLCDRAEQALRAGHSVIVDATFLEATHRRQIERVAARAHVPFNGIWLDATPESLIERVNRRRGDASDADADVVIAQVASQVASRCWETITTGDTFETVLSRASIVVRTSRQNR